MSYKARCWMCVACVVGGMAVALGAFGAHAVPRYLEGRGFDAGEVAGRLEEFHTAARYQMYGALMLLALGVAIDRRPNRWLAAAAWSMLLGVLLFGSVVYAVALVPEELRGQFGRFAPVGGTLMIAGWLLAAVGAMWPANRAAS